jgi:hypothetical protein
MEGSEDEEIFEEQFEGTRNPILKERLELSNFSNRA